MAQAAFWDLSQLPLQDSGAGVAELERAIGELGLTGLIVGSHIAGRNWDDPDLFPILEAAERLGAFILPHPFSTRAGEIMPAFHMTNLVGNPMETTVVAGNLIFAGVTERLPGLKICLSHAGGYLPFAIGRFDHGHEERAQLRQNCPKKPSEYLRAFYYDMITHSGPGLEQVINIVGAARILPGTDFPADMAVHEPVKFLNDQPLAGRYGPRRDCRRHRGQTARPIGSAVFAAWIERLDFFGLGAALIVLIEPAVAGPFTGRERWGGYSAECAPAFPVPPRGPHHPERNAFRPP